MREGEADPPAEGPWVKFYGPLDVMPWPWRRKHFPEYLLNFYIHGVRTRWTRSEAHAALYGPWGEVLMTRKQIGSEMGCKPLAVGDDQLLLARMGVLIKRSGRGRTIHYMPHPLICFNGGPRDQILIMSELKERDPEFPADIISLEGRIMSVVESHPDGPGEKKPAQSTYTGPKPVKSPVRLVTDPANEDRENVILAHWTTSRHMEGMA